MAGVPERIYQPAEGVGSTAPLPMASAEAFGSGIGAGMAQLGGVLHEGRVRALRAEKQRQDDSANAQAGVAAAGLSLELSRAAAKAREDAPLNGAGHVERVTGEADAAVGKFLEAIPSGKMRERWTARAAEIRANLIGDEDGWARGRRIEAIGTDVREGGRLWDNQLQTSPEQQLFEQALKSDQDTLDGIEAPADVKQKLIRELGASHAGNYGEGLLKKDPIAALAVFQSGALDHWLDPDKKRQLIDRAQSGVRVAAADAARQLAQQEAQLREDVTEFKQRVDRGELPADDETRALATRAQALGLANVVDDIGYSTGKLKLSRETDKWTAAEWEHSVNGLAAKVAGGKATAGDQMQLKILQELRPAKEARFRNDPEGFAAASGIPAPVVDLDNPAPGAIAAKKRWARAFAGTGWLVEPPYLNKDQLAVYRDRAAQGPVGQLEVAAELRQQWGMDAAPSIVRQLGGEAKGDMMVMLGLNPRMAQVYRRGVEALSNKTVKLDDAAAREVWRQYALAAPADVSGAVFTAARSIVAGYMSEKGFTVAPANFADNFREAIQRAGGRGGDVNDWNAPGGFAEHEGRYAWLPQDMSSNDFKHRIARAAPADWIKAAVDASGQATNAVPHHLGPHGKPVPYKNGEALRFGKGTLQTVAPGIYRLVDPAGGTVIDAKGGLWQFDVRRLPRSHVGSRAR